MRWDMKMSDDDRDLEDLFGAARAASPRPSEALLSRIETDARAVQEARTAEQAKPAAPRRGFWAVIEAFGGWPGLAGLSTAALVGVWIGVADPLDVSPLGLISDQYALLDGAEPAFGYSDLAWGLE